MLLLGCYHGVVKLKNKPSETLPLFHIYRKLKSRSLEGLSIMIRLKVSCLRYLDSQSIKIKAQTNIVPNASLSNTFDCLGYPFQV